MFVSNSPMLSVVMPVRNGLPYLNQAIEGILNQTFVDFEFIIIDDGSTDQTWCSLTAFAERDSRIVLLKNEKNIGITRSLIRGIEQARGEVIARQDADDISLPERLEKQMAFLGLHPEVGLLGTGKCYIDGQGNLLDRPGVPVVHDPKELYRRLIDQNCFTHGSVVIRKVCLDKVGSYDPRFGLAQDYDLWLKLGEITHLAVLDDVLYKFRIHSNSVSIKREYEQFLRKADALADAIQRRAVPEMLEYMHLVAARDYLWAAILAYSDGDLEGTSHALAKSSALHPPIIEQVELYERFIRYRLPVAVDSALVYIEKLFADFLPRTPKLSFLRSRLLASIHMKEVFAGAEQGEKKRVLRHLWAGIRHDPRWLLNRGVLAIAGKFLFVKEKTVP